MKKKMFGCLFTLVLCFFLTGCNEKKSNGTFTMTCTTEKDTGSGFETQSVVTYDFDKNQKATGYTVETTQKFTKKSTYETYKTAQEGTIKDTSNENVSYTLKSDDKKMTLIFAMTIKNLDKNAKTEEEIEQLKASKILKTNEERKATCKLKGITKKELK